MAEHIVKSVKRGSIAEELNIEVGDVLLKINDKDIGDIFDYQYLVEDEYLEVLIRKPSGEEWILEIDKEMDEDLGVEFENGLMDDYRSCYNKCIFCFIDQMPKGMRETLYFKDDDSRLSFLQGNYVTLTNMSEHDINRIIEYNLSPINVSIQTMNPQLRCKMLGNRFAGEALKKVDMLYEGGVVMNGQIVLCKGVNDGDELEFSIKEMLKYAPTLESVSVVPVGLSKYREGLYPLEPFNAQDAADVIDLIEKYQKIAYEKNGLHFIHASDEWYILAGRELPEEERYDGYLQLENGVGMLRLMMTEFEEAVSEYISNAKLMKKAKKAIGKHRKVTMATGRLPYPYIKRMADRISEIFEGVEIEVCPIRNDFFGELITVSGLITGQDLIAQLQGRDLGEAVLIPVNMLRMGEPVFLDDYTVEQVESALQVKLVIVKSSGQDFIDSVVYL